MGDAAGTRKSRSLMTRRSDAVQETSCGGGLGDAAEQASKVRSLCEGPGSTAFAPVLAGQVASWLAGCAGGEGG